MNLMEIIRLAWEELSGGHKVFLVLAVIVTLIIAAVGIRSTLTVNRLEKQVTAAKKNADATEKAAAVKELQAAQYQQKIIFLETNLKEIQDLARKQDEQIQNIAAVNHRARDDVRRARDVRAVQSTSADLCQQLAKVGHGCEP